jgi:putative ABC transport system permease protein
MNLNTILREAFQALKRHRIRSVLTILGIAVGIGAFICVIAIGHAGTSKIEDQLQSLGDNFIWIEAGSRTRGGLRLGARGTRSLIMRDAEAIVGQVPMIKSMSPNVDGRIQVVYGGENWATQYRGVSPEFLEIRRWTVRSGQFFTHADLGTYGGRKSFWYRRSRRKNRSSKHVAMQGGGRPRGKRIFSHRTRPG